MHHPTRLRSQPVGGAFGLASLAIELPVTTTIILRSVADVARHNPLLRTMTWAIRHRFENKHKVATIGSPLLIIHGPADEVIPFENGVGLFERATEPKSFLEICGAHNNGFATSENYRPGWEAFLTPLFGSNPVDGRD